MKKTNVPLLILIGALALVVIVIAIVHNTVLFPQMSFPWNSTPQPEVSETSSIAEKGATIDIDDPYVSGSYPEIRGESPVAQQARKAIEDLVNDFTRDAEREVPQMRSDFPEAFSSMRYELVIEARIIESPEVFSIVLDIYEYRGGANGTLVVWSFNQNTDEEIIVLGDLIPQDDRHILLSTVQTKLRNYRIPEFGPVELFEESIADLRFEDLEDFAVKEGDLFIYFDEYDVGPGSVGSLQIIITEYQNLFVQEESSGADGPRLFSGGTSCFQSDTQSDGTHTTTSLRVNITEGIVVGSKTGTIQGSEYHAGFSGALSGKRQGEVLELIYEYTVDGSRGRQEERYRIQEDTLVEEHYVLVEDFDNNILRIDESKARGETVYEQSRCE